MTTILQREQTPNAGDWIDIPGTIGLSYVSTPSDTTHRLRVKETVGGVVAFSDPFGPVVAPVGWSPVPPTSYPSAPTIRTTKLFGPQAGLGSYALFDSSWQHVAWNAQGGYFVAFSHYSTGDHVDEHWSLMRCPIGSNPDVAANWSVIYDERAAGREAANYSPAVETDENGVIYVIENAGAWSGGQWRIYKFSPSNSYGAPNIITLPTSLPPGGKFATFYDQTRKWIWISARPVWYTGAPNVFAIDTNGNLQRSAELFLGFPNPPGIHTEYPLLTMNNADASLVVGWQTLDYALAINYYDVRFAWTPDGITWKGPNGNISVPIPASPNDTGQSWPIMDAANTAEFRPVTSGSYVGNWDVLFSIIVNKGKLHNAYIANSQRTPGVAPYNRFDYAGTKTMDKKLAQFKTDGAVAGGAGYIFDTVQGNFITDATSQGRLFYASGLERNLYGAVGIAYSDNGGDNWLPYARTSAPVDTYGGLYCQAFRYPLPTGELCGAYFKQSTNEVWFWRAV